MGKEVEEKKGEVENPLTWMEGNIGAGLDQDTFDKIQKAEIAVDDLSADQLADYTKEVEGLYQRQQNGEDITVEAPEETKKKDEEALAESEKAEKGKKKPLFEKYEKATNDLNTANQKNKNLEKQKETISTELKKLKDDMKAIKEKQLTKPDDPDDYLQDDTQKALQERLDRMEGMITTIQTALENTTGAVNESLTVETERLKTETENLQASAGELGILKFQEETLDKSKFPFANLDLKTSVPVKDLNVELTTFTEKIGGMENVNRYLSDEEFKKEQDAKGISLSENFIKNVPKFNEILMCNKLVTEGQYSDHMSAYLSRLYTDGRLSKAQVEAKLEGSTAAIKKVSNENTQTALIPAGKGGGDTSPKWTMATMMKWLDDHQHVRPNTPEHKVQKEIMALVKQEMETSGTLSVS